MTLAGNVGWTPQTELQAAQLLGAFEISQEEVIQKLRVALTMYLASIVVSRTVSPRTVFEIWKLSLLLVTYFPTSSLSNQYYANVFSTCSTLLHRQQKLLLSEPSRQQMLKDLSNCHQRSRNTDYFASKALGALYLTEQRRILLRQRLRRQPRKSWSQNFSPCKPCEEYFCPTRWKWWL